MWSPPSVAIEDHELSFRFVLREEVARMSFEQCAAGMVQISFVRVRCRPADRRASCSGSDLRRGLPQPRRLPAPLVCPASH